ncbi:MAG: gamma carbonic anhydrase family protein [Candidatus Aminicenantes bacterium]|nr:gamma carbonic anhydrase family protein [Candidatus Aminicenantes bacterium]
MYDFSQQRPEIHPDTFIAEGVRIIGRVVLQAGVSVWYNSVLRADVADIVIGRNSNIQDNCAVHVDFGLATVLGENVTVGHGAILHACTIGDNCIIGMGAVILDGAVIPRNSIVGAGSLVPPRKTYPEGSLILGSPAKVVRALSADEIAHHPVHAADYVAFWKAYVEKGIGKF